MTDVLTPDAVTLCQSLAKMTGAKIVNTRVFVWQSLTFIGERIIIDFDQEVTIADDVGFSLPGIIVADISSSGNRVEALLLRS